MAIVANGNGEVRGRFTIPPNVPAGSKNIEFLGDATSATATFVGRGTLTTNEVRTVNTRINRRTLTWIGDPLAQTFVLGERTQVSGVDLWFTEVGETNLLVQIRGSELGLPTKDVITEALLSPSEITLNGWTRFEMPAVVLEAAQEYSIVIACNDAISSAAIATLGEYDVDNAQWVTAQPYQVGVLLSSSNNSTWTAHQASDLTFRLVGSSYDIDISNTKVVSLQSVSVTDADTLMVMAAVDRPTADCEVVFRLQVGGAEIEAVEGQLINLDAPYTGTISWDAVLTGTATASPVLHRDVQLLVGTRLLTGDYVSRYIDANAGTKLTVYLDAVIPGSSSIVLSYQNGDGGAFLPMTLVEPTPLGNNWVELKYEKTGFTGDGTRIKIALSGTEADRPVCRKLRAVFT